MRFAFTEHQLLFRDSVRELLARECTAGVVRAAWQDSELHALGAWRSLAELGLLGGVLHEERGGLGLDDLDLVLALEETGRAALPAPIIEHTVVGLRLLEALGSEALTRAWLPKAARGEALIAVALDGTGYVSHAADAELFVVQRADTLRLLRRAEVQLQRQRSVDGARRLYSVDFSATAGEVLASAAPARDVIALAADRGAVACAAQLIGLGQQMLDMTVEYVKTRQQFGQPIGSFQAIKHALADVLLALEIARPVVYRAAYTLARGSSTPERALHASMAKIYAGDAALLAARTALQCHGAIGYSFEHDLQLWMKRAWSLSNAWGDARSHRDRVGRIQIDRREGES